MKDLGFLIIGAQKSGTTSLHMYLKDNPCLYMPPEKEAIFFTDEQRYIHGYEKYANDFFSGANISQIWGKATPAYSCYAEVASERIAKHNRSVIIIYIIRDPIERAISQYKMNLKRGIERRSFSEIISQSTSKGTIVSPSHITELNSYFEWSKYSKVMKCYSWVPYGNFLLVEDGALRHKTDRIVSTICDMLGVEYFESPNIAREFHVGGVRRFKIIDSIRSVSILKKIWHVTVPFKYRRRVSFWMDQWNTKNIKGDDVVLTDEERSMLGNYFKEEYELLDLVKNKGGYIKPSFSGSI